MEDRRLTKEHIQAAERVLAMGDRVELIPVKEGIRVIRVRRSALKGSVPFADFM